MNLMDDDSENDSDFVPDPDEDNESLGDKRNRKGHTIQDQILSKKRKRKVDTIWEELQEEERTYLETRRALDIAQFQGHYLMEIPCRKRSKLQIAAFMHEVFGTSNLVESGFTGKGVTVADATDAAVLREAAVACVRHLKKKVVVQETRRFAGQDITIETKVMKSQEEVAKERIPGEDAKLDRLIETLKGPKAISTVTKSSTDWENYKEKEGIADEELTAAKDGFIAKSAFLNNCDVASFEQEKALRQSLRKN